MIFVTSDHHFGHKNIIKYCNRPFASVEEMDSVLIEKWNSVVGKDDEVYYVGDFTLSNFVDALDYLSVLNGKIFVMAGSHDAWMNGKPRIDVYSKKHKVQFLPPLYSLEEKAVNSSGREIPIVLCHYAMRSWDRSHYGSWHLFGHHHGKTEPYGLSFDIGVDCWDFFPVSLPEIEIKMATLNPIVDFSKQH